VHAPVDAREVTHVIAQPPRAAGERVEQAHLDVGMRVQRGNRRVHAFCVLVIQQHAHTHAALGRLPQSMSQQSAGGVRMPNVVLHIDAALRCARQRMARCEGIAPGGQRVHRGAAGMRCAGRRYRAAELCATGVAEGLGGRAFNGSGQGRTAGEHGQQHHRRDAKAEGAGR
jgi:hypothetical protein